MEVYRTLITEAGRLWENINGFSNFERYYHGYYGIKAAMLFLPPLGKGTYLGNLPGYLDDVMRKIRGGGKFYYTRSLDESLSRELLKKIRGDPPYANWEEAVRQQFDGDFLGDYNAMKRLEEGGLFGAWEVVNKIAPDFATDINILARLQADILYAPNLRNFLVENSHFFSGWRRWGMSFYSIADPVVDVLGPGRVSHLDEWNQIIGDLNANGVEVIFENSEKIAYLPGTARGRPGQIKISENASIGALKHEYTHFLDDKAAGYKGFEGAYDINFRITTEFNAYKVEIDMMNSLGHRAVVAQLKANFEQEMEYVFDVLDGQPISPSVIALIEKLKNL